MKQQPRIKVENIEEIRILVCHLIYSLGCPLSEDQLVEITSLEDAVNYFDLMQALDGITERLCICHEVNGTRLYENTALGNAAAMEFSMELPQSIREKMFAEAVRVYTRDEGKMSLVSVRYAENGNGTCTLGVSIKSPHTGRQKYYITINAENKAEADFIKDRILEDTEKFKKHIEDYFR